MGKLILNITTSLDGFIAGPDISEEQPMGLNGPKLHDWMFSHKTEADAALLNELIAATGAVILGHHTYATAIGDAWAGVSPFHAPAFVLCDTHPQQTAEGFIYVKEGIETALEKARSTAGDKDIWLMGGANVIQQYIKAGLVEEIHLHIAPLLLADGTRLFEHIGHNPIQLDCVQTISTPAATHIRYKVIKA